MPWRTQSAAAGFPPAPSLCLRHLRDPMKISAQFSFYAGLVFAVLAASYATFGLASIHPDMTAAQVSVAHGFAMFFYFLAAVCAAMAFVSWLMLKGRFGQLDQ